MARSEIFEDYLKIAVDKGLVKLAEESKELKKYKDETNARVGSDDISTIEALYGVKKNDSVEYENNIMEAAHPKPVVIAPSYDKLNGLVENNIERQNVMLNIVMKPTDGITSGHKYAKQALMMELVRIANDMDNRNIDPLRVLADDCIVKLESSEKKKFEKEAAVPVVAIVVLVAISLSAIWLLSHANDPDKGMLANCNNAVKQLTDLKTNSWYESDVDDVVQADVEKLISHINTLKQYIEDFNSIRDKVYQPRTLSEAEEIEKLESTAAAHGSQVKQILDNFIREVTEITPLLNQDISNFTSKAYQTAHTKPNWFSDVSGWLGEAMHGRWGLVANDFISAANALNPLKSSLLDALKDIKNIGTVQEKNKKQIETAKAEIAEAQKDEETDEDEEESEETTTPSNAYTNISQLMGHKPSKEELNFFNSLRN